MAVPPSSTRSSSSPFTSRLRSPPLFTPIQEVEPEDDEEAEPRERTNRGTYRHEPMPLHTSRPAAPMPKNVTWHAGGGSRSDLTVSCGTCRPSPRDKISVVPVDTNGPKRSSTNPSPTTHDLIQSIIGSLAHKSPLRNSYTPSYSAAPGDTSSEWKLVAKELSRKLLHASRKQDEEVIEVSRLKNSMSELEAKLDRLDSNYHDLQATLEDCASFPGSFPTELFIVAVNDARTAVCNLNRCLLAQLRAVPQSLDQIYALFNHPARKNRENLLTGLESLLDLIFYSEFEQGCLGECMMPDPKARYAVNRASFEALQVLCSEEVLSMGTRHYNEGLSMFCDKRMSDVIEMLCWEPCWPEVLLHAFFDAARGVWAVHLLAQFVHSPLPILRVYCGARFNSAYMEEDDMWRRGASEKPSPGVVTMMVTPGFYVHVAGYIVVKCRVLAEFGDIN